eukprot:6477316-Amphidinium_carterae.1
MKNCRTCDSNQGLAHESRVVMLSSEAVELCPQDFKKKVADIQEMLNDGFLKDIFCEQQQTLRKRYVNDDLYGRCQAATPKVLKLLDEGTVACDKMQLLHKAHTYGHE